MSAASAAATSAAAAAAAALTEPAQVPSKCASAGRSSAGTYHWMQCLLTYCPRTDMHNFLKA